jgi:dTDP-4-dehydrorhamnose 3,5-epimerase
MKVTPLPLSGLLLIQPDVLRDGRGFFLESWSRQKYLDAGIDCTFVQDNHSRSVERALRGLHYQESPGQAKLIRVVTGRIFDVAVDIRPGSPTFGRWHGHYLDEEQHHQLFIPVGFAHGFCVSSGTADVLYRVSAPFSAAAERTIAWDDPELDVEWPVPDPVLSARDRAGESFSEFRRRSGG